MSGQINSLPFFSKHLGHEIVEALPQCPLPKGYSIENEPELPWASPNDLPLECGQGILPSGRPFIVCHYLRNGAPGPETPILLFYVSEKAKVKPFTTLQATPNSPQLKQRRAKKDRAFTCIPEDPKMTWALLRAILERKGPEDTGHRRLPSTRKP